MKKYLTYFTLLVTTIMVSACSYSIKDININNKNSKCVRECSKTYSYSISQGNQVGFKTETLKAAKEAYSICIETCPNK